MSKTSTKGLVIVYVLLLAALFAVIVLAVVWWPRGDSEYIQIPTEKARSNPWLAVSTFLEKHNISLHRETPFDEESVLPYSDTVAIIDGPLSIVQKSQSDELEEWVRGGGTLIYAAKDVVNEERVVRDYHDLFPMNLNIYRQRTSAESDFRPFLEFGECQSASTEVTLANGDTAELQSATSPRVDTFDLSNVPGDLGVQVLAKDLMLRIPYGIGEVYVFSDLRRWNNANAACFDHAYILHSILTNSAPDTRAGEPISLWILPLVEVPSLALMLWNRYPFVIVGLALALVMVLINWNVRLSPPKYEIFRPRRSAFEYATSGAKFAWRTRHLGPYLKALCSYALHNRSDLEKERHTKQAAQTMGVPETFVKEAIHSQSTPVKEGSLIERVRLVQAFYKSKEPALDEPSRS